MRRVADQRILVGRDAVLSWVATDSEGEPSDAGGAVTVKVDTLPGAPVLAVGAAEGDGPTYTRALDAADNATLELLVASWYVDDVLAATTLVEVVGGYYFTIAGARARDEALRDELRFTTAALIRTRREVEDHIEGPKATAIAWVPRYACERVSGTGRSWLVLPHQFVRTVRSVRVYSSATAYTSFTSDELAAIPGDEAGVVTRTDGGVWPIGRDNIVLEYEHGADRPPEDLVAAAVTHCRLAISEARSGFSAQPLTITEAGGETIEMPSPWRTVFAAYKRHSRRQIGFA